MIHEKVTHTRNGDKTEMIYIDPGHINEMEKLGGWMENSMLEAIARMGITGTYVDIGAHVGNHTIFFAKYTKATMVHAYEAIPQIFEVLKQNAEPYKDRIILHNHCIGELTGSYQPLLNTKRPAQSKIDTGEGGKDLVITPLQMESKVGLIKIDVEGGEYEVVRGCMDVIERDKPDLFIETFNDFERVLDLLPSGYQKITRYNTAPTYHFTVTNNI